MVGRLGREQSARHAGYVIARLEADAFPVIGAAGGGRTDGARIRATGEEHRSPRCSRYRAPGAADLRTGHALRRGARLAERNPVADVKPGDVLRAQQQIDYARIRVTDLPELLRRIDAYQGSPYTRLAMKLMLVTFVRTGELIGARWSEFDLERAEWKIPAERTKSRREHTSACGHFARSSA